MDAISIQRIKLLHPRLRPEAEVILLRCGLKLTGDYGVRFTHTLRSFDEQDFLFEQGRTRPGKVVTWAKGGESFHNYGMAIDICLLKKDGKMVSFDTKLDADQDAVADWIEALTVFKNMGWEWGGDWPKGKRDMPHFQKTFGMSTKELFELSKIQNTVYAKF